MTQEEKQLLLKDLCARLPYGVIVRHSDCIVDDEGNETGKFYHTKGYLCDVCTEDDMTTTIIESEGEDEGYNHICSLEWTVPYLRPMDSMTVEEICKIEAIIGNGFKYGDGELTVCGEDVIKLSFPKIHELMEFLYQHHIDVNCLIEKGLAIEVEKGMYNF